MLTVADPQKYRRHRAARDRTAGRRRWCYELWLPVLLFGSIGAITWAIRGSNGWGGIDGTIVPGMTWGLLWYYVCLRKGIDARGIPLWLGLGIALGGELGYGQYVSWIQGHFNVGDQVIAVAPWYGYVWFVLAGIGWGAPGGIALGWALGGSVSWRRWLVRLLVPLGTAYCGWLLVQWCPWLFFPNYDLSLYAGELDHHLARTVYTNTQNFTAVAWWGGALLVAACQRDRATLAVGTLIGAGFGLGFTFGALWCLGYSYAPGLIDWWKVWELNAGFNLGALYVIALYWATHEIDRRTPLDSIELAASNPRATMGGRHRSLSLVLSVSLLLLILCRGASLALGGLLGCYDLRTTNQYSWPTSRVVLFAPAAILITGAVLVYVWRIMWPSATAEGRRSGPHHLPERMADLMTGLGVVGAITIWPDKTSVLYAVFLFIAIFSLNRLNRHFDNVDAITCLLE